MESHTNNAVNVAQATLEELGSQFVRVCVDHERGPLPMEADQLSYACLLLCDEHADALGTNAPNVIANCLKAARAASLWEWIDILPWQCCLERLGVEKYGNATNQLIGNLDHRRSDIRLFLFEIAWFYRPRMNPRWVTPKLLKNMADTLGGWHRSAGLCAAMQESDEAFMALAEQYDAGDFADQFKTRLDYLKEHGLCVTRIHFYKLEASVRKRIADAAFAINGMNPRE